MPEGETALDDLVSHCRAKTARQRGSEVRWDLWVSHHDVCPGRALRVLAVGVGSQP